MRGLAEKQEFVAALREAIAERGPPPQPQRRLAKVTAPKPLVLSEEEAARQMAELQAQLERQAVEAAAAAGTVAVEVAATAAEIVAATAAVPQANAEVVGCPALATSSVLSGARPRERRKAGVQAVEAVAAPEAARKRRRVALEVPRIGKGTKEVVVSDGEDEVCEVAADLDDDDDVKRKPVAAVQATKVDVSIVEDLDEDEQGEPEKADEGSFVVDGVAPAAGALASEEEGGTWL